MSAPPWFRFYSEALKDRKLERICRIVEQPKCLVLGAWATLMALANSSPIRGALLLTEDMPFELEDLADEMGLPLTLAATLLEQFERFQMIHQDGMVFYLSNWDKRQFASDSSTERVRRYRDRRQEDESPEETPEPEPDSEPVTEPVTVSPIDDDDYETLQKRFRNLPEQNRTEQSRDRSDMSRADARSESLGGTSPPSNGLTEGQRYWLDSFGAKRFANSVQKEAVLALERTYGTDVLAAGIQWAAKQGMGMGRALTSLETALPKWGKAKGKGDILTVRGL